MATSVNSERVLRRALLVWGLGHITLGDRRGWLLMAAQPLAVVGLLIVAAQLLDGTRWLVIFPPLATLIVVWLAQAIHAYLRARELGAPRGGELQVTLFLPFAVAALTALWLLGGRFGSPSATVQAYMEAWIVDRPDIGATLFVEPGQGGPLGAAWSTQNIQLRALIAAGFDEFGASSGLDPERPFDSLRVREVSLSQGTQPEQASFIVEIVRSRRVETTVLGVIPTAGQETVVVQPGVRIDLLLVHQRPPIALPGLESFVWSISAVELLAS